MTKTENEFIKPIGVDFSDDLLKMAYKKMLPDWYLFTPEIKELTKNMFFYFLGKDTDLDKRKGVALIGKYGVGKSILFQLMHDFLEKHFYNCPNTFRISSIEEIIDATSKQGWIDGIFCRNIKEDVRGGTISRPVHLLINEFGHKYDVKSFGSNVNENIEMFLMKRYDLFQQNNILTHITTNYDSSDFKTKFDPRVVDRFKEMFNMQYLDGESFRK